MGFFFVWFVWRVLGFWGFVCFCLVLGFFNVRCNFSSLTKIHLFLECKTSWTNILHEKWCGGVDRLPRGIQTGLFYFLTFQFYIGLLKLTMIYFSISCVFPMLKEYIVSCWEQRKESVWLSSYTRQWDPVSANGKQYLDLIWRT